MKRNRQGVCFDASKLNSKTDELIEIFKKYKENDYMKLYTLKKEKNIKNNQLEVNFLKTYKDKDTNSSGYYAILNEVLKEKGLNFKFISEYPNAEQNQKQYLFYEYKAVWNYSKEEKNFKSQKDMEEKVKEILSEFLSKESINNIKLYSINLKF